MKIRELVAQLQAFAPDVEIHVCLHPEPQLESTAELEPNACITRAEGTGAALLHVELWRPPLAVRRARLSTIRGGKR